MAGERILSAIKRVGISDAIEIAIVVPIFFGISIVGVLSDLAVETIQSAILAALSLLLLATVRAGARYAQLARGQQEILTTTAAFVDRTRRLTERYPLEYIGGHKEVENYYVRIINECRDEMVVLGYGVDLSDPYWKNQINDYLTAIDNLLSRCRLYYRIQVLAGSPIEWLRYQARVQQEHENFHLVFIDTDLMSANRSVFQLFLADGERLGIFVNVEVQDEDDEFAIQIAGHQSVQQIRRHLLTVVASKCTGYDDGDLVQIMYDLETSRTMEIRSRVADQLKRFHRRGDRYLPWGRDVVEFKRVCPEVPDYSIHYSTMDETANLWQVCRDLTETEFMQAVDRWVTKGQYPR